MKRTHRTVVVGGLLALALGLAGCFFISRPPITEATLVFSDLTGSVGGQGEITVSVSEMPGGGLAVIVVGMSATGGLLYDPAQFQPTDVVGLNGFTVLAWGTFDAGGGLRHLRFVAVNPHGVVTGDVAKIVGNRVGAGEFNFQATNIELADASANPIATYTLVTGKTPPYFVKGGK